MSQPSQVTCHECDLLVALKPISEGQKLTCPRCRFVFTRKFPLAQEKLMAFGVSGLFFLVLSFAFPFLSFITRGSDRTIVLLDSMRSLQEFEFFSVAMLLMLTTIIIPGLVLFAVLYVLIAIKWKLRLPMLNSTAKLISYLIPWNMAEIFLIGILVSLIKITSLAQIEFGYSFYCYVLFVLCLTATLVYFDRFQLWYWIRQVEFND